MMKVYARVVDGVVIEIIQPFAGQDGAEVPIEERFVPQLVAQMIDVTNVDPQPDQLWTWDGKNFAAPVPHQPTPAEIMAANVYERDRRLGIATLAIAPLQDAVDLDDATPAELALLKKWKAYRVAVNRIDLTLPEPTWPTPPA